MAAPLRDGSPPKGRNHPLGGTKCPAALVAASLGARAWASSPQKAQDHGKGWWSVLPSRLLHLSELPHGMVAHAGSRAGGTDCPIKPVVVAHGAPAGDGGPQRRGITGCGEGLSCRASGRMCRCASGESCEGRGITGWGDGLSCPGDRSLGSACATGGGGGRQCPFGTGGVSPQGEYRA